MATVVCRDKCNGVMAAQVNILCYPATKCVWRKCSLQPKSKQTALHGLIYRGNMAMAISKKHSEGVMENAGGLTEFEKLNWKYM